MPIKVRCGRARTLYSMYSYTLMNEVPTTYNLILYGISTWTIQYQLILQSTVESSSGQTECFSLPTHSESCNMRLCLLFDC